MEGWPGLASETRRARTSRVREAHPSYFLEREERANLISLKDGLDLVTPAGRLMANILAGVAAYEMEVRAERILAGQEAARGRGVHCGGSRRGRKIKVTVEQVATIQRLGSEGDEIAAIARATGLSRPTVDRILGEDCLGSSGPGGGKPTRSIDCAARPL